jgi:hypothetical protein
MAPAVGAVVYARRTTSLLPAACWLSGNCTTKGTPNTASRAPKEYCNGVVASASLTKLTAAICKEPSVSSTNVLLACSNSTL